MTDFARESFPHAELATALGRLAGDRARVDAGGPPRGLPGDARLERYVDAVLAPAHLEVDAIAVPCANLSAFLANCAPALLRLPGDAPRYLAVRRVQGARLVIAAPQGGEVGLPIAKVSAVLRGAIEGPDCEGLFERAGLKGAGGDRAREALRSEWLAATPVQVGWTLKLAPGAPFAQRARSFALHASALRLLASSAALYLMWVAAWWLLGRGALEGKLDQGWLLAFGLMLASLVPLRAFRLSAAGELALRTGALLRGWLLAGSLQLDPDEIRTQGPGQLLGIVLESEILERAVTTGAIGLVALLEVIIGAGVLWLGAGAGLQVTLLFIWIALCALLTRRLTRQIRKWTDARLPLTCALVEEMLGQRTRVAQLGVECIEARADLALGEYYERSRAMDRSLLALTVLVPRGWLLLGMSGLIPAFLYSTPSTTSLAVGLGGVLLIYQALRAVAPGLVQFALARVTWERLRPLFEAAKRPQDTGIPHFSACFEEDEECSQQSQGDAHTILTASGLGYNFVGRGQSVLHDIDLTIRSGERILIQGASGSGKSTLAALLAGSRATREGVLLLDGLDRATIGAHAWRQRVVLAPQFHENHVLSDTFAFNLLMGAQWPPTEASLQRAHEICLALGLGPLLERMPNGLFQMVGETGWQLSHGERSRLFIARALLQNASLVILDESFSTLDPLTFERAFKCVLEHAGTLALIEHR